MLAARPWASFRKKKGGSADNSSPTNTAKDDKETTEQCEHVDSIRLERIKRKILNPSMWSCSECGTTEGVWACLTCGKIGCGRYQSEHALAHYTDHEHPLALEINLKYCFCYECDQYVTNDNKKEDIEALRKLLDIAQSADETLSTTRSGRVIRPPQKLMTTPKEFDDDDRLHTAIKYWRLRTFGIVFQCWREFTEECKQAKKKTESPPPSSGLSRTNTPILSDRSGLTRSQIINFNGSRIIPGITGLRNLGNTCFMNTVLQALSNTSDFCNFFIHILGMPPPEGSPPPAVKLNGRIYVRRATIDCFEEATHHVPKLEEVSLTMQLHSLLRVLWSGKWAVATPWALLESVWKFVPKFRNRQQQDAQEFLCYLFDRLQLELQSHYNETAPQTPEKDKDNNNSTAKNTPTTPRLTRSASKKLDFDKVEGDANKENTDVNVPKSPPFTPSNRPTIITEIFQGKLLSEVVCSKCKHKSTKIDPFFDLSVDIPVVSLARPTRGRRRIHNVGPSTNSKAAKSKDIDKEPPSDGSKKRKRGGKDDTEENGAKKAKTEQSNGVKTIKQGSDDDYDERGPETCKLEDCLYSFIKPETLEGYTCDNCHVKADATKRLYLHTLPRVLCIVLKRFCWTSVSRAKIDTQVHFPFVLDVKDYVMEGVQHTGYNLTSIVLHHGTGLLSGHYTSYCYNKLQNGWVHYNDSRVTFVTKEDIEREAPSKAYLLFYERQDNSTSRPLSAPPNAFKISPSLSAYTYTFSPKK